MRKLLAAAACGALVPGLVGCRGDSHSKPPAAKPTATVPATDPALAQMRKLFRACKVRQTVSLHDGTLYLKLRNGTRVDLPKRLEPALNAEVARSTGRCPGITAVME
jgi:hypothetical protein